MAVPQPPLEKRDHLYLQEVLAQSRQAAPDGWWPLTLGAQPLGLISPDRVEALGAWLPLAKQERGWRWPAEHLDSQTRSDQLRQAADGLRQAGWITGWRDEAYASWGTVDMPGEAGVMELFRLERAAFRFFGFRSHAVHINGLTHDGRVWRAQRAWTKATDPGMGDNLAAGGLTAGESVLSCAWRELQEEAGLSRDQVASFSYVGTVVTERMEREGWHSESLQVFNAVLQPSAEPINRDGEVESFACLTPAEVIDSMRHQVWTLDAACAMALAWRAGEGNPDHASLAAGVSPRKHA